MRMIVDPAGAIVLLGDLRPPHGIDLSGVKVPADFIETAIDGKYKWINGAPVAVAGWVKPPPPPVKESPPSVEERLASLENKIKELESNAR